jgi:hypothetical protein
MQVWVMVLCLVPLISLVSGNSPVPASAEEFILSHILPGYWEIWDGGGPEGFCFRDDGTVTVFRYDSTSYETTWQWNKATELQKQEIWSHPQLVLQVGENTYGIHLELEGLTVNGRERISEIPWSFSLTIGEGGGGYIRPRQSDRLNGLEERSE